MYRGLEVIDHGCVTDSGAIVGRVRIEEVRMYKRENGIIGVTACLYIIRLIALNLPIALIQERDDLRLAISKILRIIEF